jgi:adenylosuccinate synthase
LSGWEEDLTKMRSEDELPKAFMDYVAFIEAFVETPIKIVSVGPDRNQTIFRSS